jgi:glutaminase
MNCEQLAMAGGTYANYGTNPLTHKCVCLCVEFSAGAILRYL